MIFRREKHTKSHFEGFFEEADTFLRLNFPEQSEGQFIRQKSR
jgi:hypothetical protein